jgi:hypothetical protein
MIIKSKNYNLEFEPLDNRHLYNEFFSKHLTNYDPKKDYKINNADNVIGTCLQASGLNNEIPFLRILSKGDFSIINSK